MTRTTKKRIAIWVLRGAVVAAFLLAYDDHNLVPLALLAVFAYAEGWLARSLVGDRQ